MSNEDLILKIVKFQIFVSQRNDISKDHSTLGIYIIKSLDFVLYQ